jgi:hypothetical protein
LVKKYIERASAAYCCPYCGEPLSRKAPTGLSFSKDGTNSLKGHLKRHNFVGYCHVCEAHFGLDEQQDLEPIIPPTSASSSAATISFLSPIKAPHTIPAILSGAKKWHEQQELCQDCARQQRLKAEFLRHYSSSHDGGDSQDVQSYKKSLDVKYNLCDSCEDFVRKKLEKQASFLQLGYHARRRTQLPKTNYYRPHFLLALLLILAAILAAAFSYSELFPDIDTFFAASSSNNRLPASWLLYACLAVLSIFILLLRHLPYRTHTKSFKLDSPSNPTECYNQRLGHFPTKIQQTFERTFIEPEGLWAPSPFSATATPQPKSLKNSLLFSHENSASNSLSTPSQSPSLKSAMYRPAFMPRVGSRSGSTPYPIYRPSILDAPELGIEDVLARCQLEDDIQHGRRSHLILPSLSLLLLLFSILTFCQPTFLAQTLAPYWT